VLVPVAAVQKLMTAVNVRAVMQIWTVPAFVVAQLKTVQAGKIIPADMSLQPL
jgi:hypothetical protein